MNTKLPTQPLRHTIAALHLCLITLSALGIQPLLSSCSDDPGVENYYTAKGLMANSYLTSQPDTYGKFVDIINKSTMVNLDLLGTYGSYTVFAPNNEAIDLYLAGRGMTSVDDLTTEDCDTIAATHIIEQSYFTTDFSNATLPTMNMLDRYLTITCIVDSSDMATLPIAYYINATSRIVQRDDSVENGVVHTVDRVINTTTQMLPDFMMNDTTINLFNIAMQLTHMGDSMRQYIDESYTISVDSFAEGRCLLTGTTVDNVSYMERRYIGFTGFIEPDAVFAEHGIYTIDDLRAYAKQVYDDMYPEDADVTDETDRRNSLNRFVSYHFLPERIVYNMLTPDNRLLTANFDRRHWDVADWYETMMPYSLMKISYPSGTQAGRYVNRRGLQNHRDSRGVFVPGAKILSPSESGVDMMAVNGVYHYLADLIDYGRETQEVVLNERLRIDATTLSPDFMTSGARGHSVRGVGGCPDFPGQYGARSASYDPVQNVNTCLAFKEGSVKNWIFKDTQTHIHVRNRYLDFWSYQGDELQITGMYDIQFRIPPVPEGEYELRIQVCIGFETRGIIQVYFDGAPCGIPIDLRKHGDDPSIGWRSDNELGDDEAITAYDKALHNRGWMKGPASYGGTSADGTGGRTPQRNIRDDMRRIYTTFHSDGHTDHWVRVQQKLETSNGSFAFDYMELCPRSVYNNEQYPEDRW